MKQSEALRQYYNGRNIRVTDHFHPLTPGAQRVTGISPLDKNVTSILKPSAHAVVVFQENSQIYNLLNRDTHTKGFYGFPGGSNEGSETPEECVTREIVEELGYEPNQYILTTLGFLVTGSVHFPLYLVDITEQIPVSPTITGSTDIAITTLEELYRCLPHHSQDQVKSVINSRLTSRLAQRCLVSSIHSLAHSPQLE